jgi:hypothetical protein
MPLGLDESRDALQGAVPVRLAPIPHREAVDVDQSLVVAKLEDPAQHRHGAVPIAEVEHRDGDLRVTPNVPQAQPLEIHVDEDAPVVPVVPGRC